MLPVVAFPGLVAGLSRTGDGVEAPDLVAGRGIVGGDEAADPELASADADDHLVVDDQRRHGDRVGALDVGDFGLPEWLAVGPVEGDEMCVERAHEEPVAEDGDAAVVGTAADQGLVAVGVAELPEHAAGDRVERHDVVGALRHVHDAVDDDRARLPGAEHLVLEHPLHLKIGDVRGRDLVEAAVALTRVGAVVVDPVVRLVGGLQEPLRSDLAGERADRENRDRDGDGSHELSHFNPLSVSR